MSCQNDCDRRGVRGTGHCVGDVVRRILDAQRKAADESDYGCTTSCDRSIDDLLSPSRRGPSRHTTIPFMLTCKDGCSTFFGSGFTDHGHHRHRHFHCIESPIFKVRGFVRGSKNCARIELLKPVYHHEHDHDHGPREDDDLTDYHHGNHSNNSVCGYFGGRPIKNFCHTGVCITVDLDCFCGISCLDPVTPED